MRCPRQPLANDGNGFGLFPPFSGAPRLLPIATGCNHRAPQRLHPLLPAKTTDGVFSRSRIGHDLFDNAQQQLTSDSAAAIPASWRRRSQTPKSPEAVASAMSVTWSRRWATYAPEGRARRGSRRVGRTARQPRRTRRQASSGSSRQAMRWHGSSTEAANPSQSSSRTKGSRSGDELRWLRSQTHQTAPAKRSPMRHCKT
jgi:hypothetical protein